MNLRTTTRSIVSFAVACVVLSSPLAAQEQAKDGKSVPLGIGVVDVQRIVRESAATKSMRPQLEKLKKGYEEEVRKQEKELRAADQELTRQRAILSPEAFTERRKELQRRANSVQRSLQDRKRMFDQAISKSMGKVHLALRQIAVELAKEKGISLVLPKSSVFLVAKRYDITAEALERLNKKLPSVSISLPEKK